MNKTEMARLKSLESYGIDLLTPDEALDRITRLARDVFATPIALMSLIDRDRQWCKSRQGVDLASTDRAWSFCDHAIREGSGGMLIVEDASADDRFAANPLVVDSPGVRFYMGAALKGRDGHYLGALCVVDFSPRPAPGAAEIERIQGLAAMAIDVLELRRVNREISTQHIELQRSQTALHESEAGFRRLADELEEARAKAEAAAAVKGEFLANMSHELRTPITSILGFTRLASWQKDLSEESRGYVERIADAGRALLVTVNDILDFSSLEAGKVVIRSEPVRIEPLCRSTLGLFDLQAQSKSLDLKFENGCEKDLAVEVDPDRLGQLLLNLIGNAIKFTDQGAVELRMAHDAARAILRIEVRDTGPGIAPDLVGRLFARFSQVDGSLSRARGGTGLGLAICKGLVKAMGGEIGVKSRPGKGSCFWLEIPAPVTKAPDVAPAPDQAPSPNVMADVLVVDDHAANRLLAKVILTMAGAKVWEAESGEQAVSMARQRPFDVILMDLRMPGLDGLGALKRIREGQGLNRSASILDFTADADTRAAERLIAQGFQGMAPKPIEPDELVAMVREATEGTRARRLRAFA